MSAVWISTATWLLIDIAAFGCGWWAKGHHDRRTWRRRLYIDPANTCGGDDCCCQPGFGQPRR